MPELSSGEALSQWISWSGFGVHSGRCQRKEGLPVYQDFAYHFILIARKLYQNEEPAIELDYSLYAFDSTTIDLCLSLFPWAHFLHTLLDLRGPIPTFIRLTTGKVHDVDILDTLPMEKSAVITMVRGYVDFARLYAINLFPAFFVIRAKSNLRYRRVKSREVDKTLGSVPIKASF